MKRHLMFIVVASAAVLCGCHNESGSVEVQSVTLSTASLEMLEGDNAILSATVLPKDADYDELLWASSNQSVASVNSGVVTALTAGTTTITASAGGKMATCYVQVSSRYVPVASVALDKSSLNILPGEISTLSATVYPENATNNVVSWRSLDESVVTVKDGLVTAVNVGTTSVIVTAEDGGKTAECKVTVDPVKVTGVSLSATSLSMMVDDVTTLRATVTPKNATNKAVQWSSDNENVAIVKDGKVTAKSKGSAKITVTTEDGSKSATCSVTVTDDISWFVSAKYLGGSLLIANDLILTGSKLNFGVYNSSRKTITVNSVQLIDGVTGSKGNVMTINHKITGNSDAAWTITITGAGIHKPIAEFVYTYKGQEYSTQAQYYSINIGI